MGEEFNRSLRRTSGLRAGCERAANDAVLPVSAFPTSLSGEDNEDAVRYSGREELECRRFSSTVYLLYDPERLFAPRNPYRLHQQVS